MQLEQQMAIAGVVPGLANGAFVRVLKNHTDATRAGADGQVVCMDPEGVVTLIFGHDRYNRPQSVRSVGPEAWLLDELDLASVEL